MGILSKEKPILFFNVGKEHREAYLLMLSSGIDCDFRPAADVDSPTIFDHYNRYVGLNEIKNFIEEYKNEMSKQATKKINIETIRYPIENNEYINLRGLISLLSFDVPVKDFNGKENNRLCLKTAWEIALVKIYYKWNIWLESENGDCICDSSSFNELNKDLSSYSKARLKEWQETGIRKHKGYLLKIEDLYWQGGEIPKEFLR